MRLVHPFADLDPPAGPERVDDVRDSLVLGQHVTRTTTKEIVAEQLDVLRHRRRQRGEPKLCCGILTLGTASGVAAIGQLVRNTGVDDQQLEAMGRLRQTMLDEAESQMVQLALEIGQRMACEAQLGDTSWVAPLVRQASEALTQSDRAVCRLSPQLAERLNKEQAWPEIQGMVFEISPDLDDLDLVVESRFGRVDASFRERLGHLERTLRERIEKVSSKNIEQDVA